MIWRTQSPSDETFDPPNASFVEIDMLELLLAELQSRGLDYAPVIRVMGQDIEAPGLFPRPDAPINFVDVRLTQHEVILARKSDELRLTNIQGGRYDAHASVPTKVGAVVELYWAWASVDVTIGERTFRFATTHLDPNNGTLQWAQADEFLRGPGATELPIVWVGDFNSDADGTSFTGDPPATDTYLQLHQPRIHRRMDRPAARSGGWGLWPSDHAGVVVTLQL